MDKLDYLIVLVESLCLQQTPAEMTMRQQLEQMATDYLNRNAGAGSRSVMLESDPLVH
jgi:hypothetical protein